MSVNSTQISNVKNSIVKEIKPVKKEVLKNNKETTKLGEKCKKDLSPSKTKEKNWKDVDPIDERPLLKGGDMIKLLRVL